jgi:hypothetical protein
MIKSITLLDGSIWDKNELIKNMDNDEFYYNLCGKNMLSSSSAKLLLHSYKKYYYVQKYGYKSSQALIDGWLFHTSILEPDVFSKQIFVDVASKNTKAFKDAKNKYKVVFTKKEKSDAERLADAFLKNPDLVKWLNKGDCEVPIAGEVMGMPFRGKADIITKKGEIIDLKTTVNIDKFRNSAFNFSYDLQCYVYCNLFKVDYSKFYFIALDKENLVPKFCTVSKEFYQSGEYKCEKAIKEYKENVNKDINEYLQTEIL